MGDKEVTMDEITLITESLQEKVGGDVNVIWGAGKDETLGDKLRVAVIAVGFNRSSAIHIQSPLAREREKGTEVSFKVEEMPEELEMVTVNSTELEEQARQKRLKQESRRLRE